MGSEILILGLAIRCTVLMWSAKDRFFHRQAWSAWMTFFVALIVLHVWAVAGALGLVPEAQVSALAGALDAAMMVTLWIAIELSLPTLGRRLLETHNEILSLRAKTAKSVKPSSAPTHAPGDEIKSQTPVEITGGV